MSAREADPFCWQASDRQIIVCLQASVASLDSGRITSHSEVTVVIINHTHNPSLTHAPIPAQPPALPVRFTFPTHPLDIPKRGCSIFPSVRNTPSNTVRGENSESKAVEI